MTGASKLFHSRRIRFGNRNNAIDDRDSDSSPPDGNSSRHITTTRRHHHRRNLDGCNSLPRHIHRHRHSEPVGSQFQSGSIINSEDFRNIRRWGANENDRLPGVVLLARERLLERLRGVHISEINTSSSNLHQDNSSYNGYSTIIEINSNLVDEPVTGSWHALMAPGLSRDALNSLSIKVYSNIEEDNESQSGSRECSICLEGFEDGDGLINLPCMHRFHSYCLIPWVEVCGACPNCRKAVVINSSNKLVS